MSSSILFSWDFANGTQGWQGGFADYPLGQEDFFNLDFGERSLSTYRTPSNHRRS